MNESNLKNSSQKVFVKAHDEEILVVERSLLFPEGVTSGLSVVDMKTYEERVLQKGTFIWRSAAETDPTYKQIIPYLIFMHEDNYFLMQRSAKASEVRLKNKYSLGIGGHLRKEDLGQGGLLEWASREFHEEVNYEGNFEVTPVGLINDDSSLVGQVHAGFVFLLKGNSSKISVKSELKSGKLLSQRDCEALYSSMETWSQWAFDAIKKGF